MSKPSSYSQVTRNMVENLKQDFTELNRKVDERFDKFDVRITELFNHQSNRLPMWATVAFTIGGSLISGLIIWAVSR